MTADKKTCKYCGLQYKRPEEETSLFFLDKKWCPKCETIHRIDQFVSEYDKRHKDAVWKNKIHDKNMIKDNYNYGNGVTSYTLAKFESSYRIEKRTKRVKNAIDSITYIREYLYLNLDPIFKILDSIYIDKDIFWNETGNLIRYVHNCCFQEAVIKLAELLSSGKSKYSVRKIKNILIEDSKYIFNEQEIYERLEFEKSKDVLEERFEPFDIKGLGDLIDAALEENDSILKAMKDFRDNRFAHIDSLDSHDSSKYMSYVNIKRMFALAKSIYDALLFVVAPDKYASLIVNPNIWFPHLNAMTKAYKKHLENEKRIINETIKKI